MKGDRLTRWTTIAAVLAVAGVAGWVSYWHCTALVTAHGEPGTTGHLYAATIDGLIIAASMVLLDAARHGDDKAPRLAWWMLGAGIGATLTVNVLAGLASGWLGAVIAGWPAAAFVASYELLMVLLRASGRRGPVAAVRADETAPQDPAAAFREMVEMTEELGLYDEAGNADENARDAAGNADVPEVPRDAEHAALLALKGTMAAGNPLSDNQLTTRFGLTRAQAKKVRKLALGDDGEQHEEGTAKPLLGMTVLRRVGEREDRQADDDAEVVPA